MKLIIQGPRGSLQSGLDIFQPGAAGSQGNEQICGWAECVSSGGDLMNRKTEMKRNFLLKNEDYSRSRYSVRVKILSENANTKKFLSEIRIEKAATAGYSFNPGALSTLHLAETGNKH